MFVPLSAVRTRFSSFFRNFSRKFEGEGHTGEATSRKLYSTMPVVDKEYYDVLVSHERSERLEWRAEWTLTRRTIAFSLCAGCKYKREHGRN